MRRLWIVAALLAVSTTIAAPPPLTKVLTFPTVPSAKDLDPLSLQLKWNQILPVATAQNGIGTLQIVGNQIFAQLRDGTILALDAESGNIQWTTRVSKEYPVIRRFGFGADILLALDDNRLFALDMRTGRQRWFLDLPDVPIAPPTAGDLFLFVPFSNGRVITYSLPETTVRALQLNDKQRGKLADEIAKIRQRISGAAPLVPTGANLLDPRGGSAGSGAPIFSSSATRRSASETDLTNARSAASSMALHKSASYVTKPATATELTNAAAEPLYLSSRSPGFRVDNPILHTPYGNLITGRTAETLTLRRDPNHPTFSYTASAPLSVAPSSYGDTAYFGCDDGAIYALNIALGAISWKVSGPAPLAEPMIATETSLYCAAREAGIVKFARATGAFQWLQPEGQSLVAASGTFLYATDRLGRLLVIETGSGQVVGRYDISGWKIHVVNRVTDRLLFAANNGMIICLRDASQATPLIHAEPAPPLPPIRATSSAR